MMVGVGQQMVELLGPSVTHLAILISDRDHILE